MLSQSIRAIAQYARVCSRYHKVRLAPSPIGQAAPAVMKGKEEVLPRMIS
jgi:hypothetical protein